MDLTPEQQDLVTQFVSISGAEDDRQKVVSLLTVNNWDLNNALSSYFDHGFDVIDRISQIPEGKMQQYLHRVRKYSRTLQNRISLIDEPHLRQDPN